jgi:hypothetical protein
MRMTASAGCDSLWTWTDRIAKSTYCQGIVARACYQDKDASSNSYSRSASAFPPRMHMAPIVTTDSAPMTVTMHSAAISVVES